MISTGRNFYLGGCKSVAAKLQRGPVMAEYVQALLKERWPQGKLQQRGVCKLCGCTEDRACSNGCAWVAPDLCSTCAEVFIAVIEWQENAHKPSLMRLHHAATRANRNPAARK